MGDLWCVHVLGSDDVIAAPDRAAAIRRAANMNVVIEREAAKHPGDDNFPDVKCVAELWPWSAEAHADSLAREPNWGELPAFVKASQ